MIGKHLVLYLRIWQLPAVSSNWTGLTWPSDSATVPHQLKCLGDRGLSLDGGTELDYSDW